MVATSDVEYDVDGIAMIGRLAVPDGDDVRPAVLLAHEGPGLDDYQRERASSFAALGYVTFALDYHGGGRLITDRDEMMARVEDLWQHPSRMRRRGRAGLDVLLGQPRVDAQRVAAVGYCFGGGIVLELARDGVALAAVVGFHPRLSSNQPAGPGDITGKVLVCVGSRDPYIPLEERLAFAEEMDGAGADWRMIVYGGAEHSFTHPWVDHIDVPGLAYDRTADERSWRAMLDLFAEVF
jgi:dienelactone hydrolase